MPLPDGEVLPRRPVKNCNRGHFCPGTTHTDFLVTSICAGTLWVQIGQCTSSVRLESLVTLIGAVMETFTTSMREDARECPKVMRKVRAFVRKLPSTIFLICVHPCSSVASCFFPELGRGGPGERREVGHPPEKARPARVGDIRIKTRSSSAAIYVRPRPSPFTTPANISFALKPIHLSQFPQSPQTVILPSFARLKS